MMQNRGGKMKMIGITGGVGSGKSEVLKVLKEDYHAHIIMADQVAHELMEPGKASYDGIRKAFGEEVLNEDGTIHRETLGKIVFQEKEKLEQLNSITHIAVDHEILKRISRIKKTERNPLIVCEAALLVGAEYESLFEQLWYVYAKEEIRYERLRNSRGYTDEKICQMMKNQKSEEEFQKAATHVIDNSGNLEETKRQIKDILAKFN